MDKVVVNVLTHFPKDDPKFLGSPVKRSIRINGMRFSPSGTGEHEKLDYIAGVIEGLRWVYGREYVLAVWEKTADM